MKIYALAALLAIAVAPTAVAHADSADDTFLKALADQGITGDPAELVAAGRGVCDNVSGLATTLPKWSKAPALGPVMGALNLSLFQAEFVVSAAESAYCPQYLGLGR
ncbi:DUF732 domain-containing protein [Mycobacterium kyorinense]|uniref:DUF732 domain-containing protein n=1 Tax=Mycobacterium kyorinense TaxID=487514 RepID=A0A1X1YDC4_9MYCO|nr:DUF732 domain-containing protein [Mycobacterium kyorinense]ORW09044.1 hypothetical protein AWC14_22295 [Mycobacterium kyorinense]